MQYLKELYEQGNFNKVMKGHIEIVPMTKGRYGFVFSNGNRWNYSPDKTFLSNFMTLFAVINCIENTYGKTFKRERGKMWTYNGCYKVNSELDSMANAILEFVNYQITQLEAYGG